MRFRFLRMSPRAQRRWLFEFRHALADDAPRNPGGSGDRRDASWSNRLTFCRGQQPSRPFIQPGP